MDDLEECRQEGEFRGVLEGIGRGGRAGTEVAWCWGQEYGDLDGEVRGVLSSGWVPLLHLLIFIQSCNLTC